MCYNCVIIGLSFFRIGGLFVLMLLSVISSNSPYHFYLTIVLCVIFVVFLLILHDILHSPFQFPYFIYEFDVSGKRKPSIENCLDEFLVSGGFSMIESYCDDVEQWKFASIQRVEGSILKQYRMKQFERACDVKEPFRFSMYRLRTKYKQVNYVKYPYKVEVFEGSYSYSYAVIKKRYDALVAIDFACTLQQYHSKNQRSLCTRAVREKIMKRDDYTCQICGKYMPDEVGLQVDHIVPVSRGGKTIPSNLRVLCSKCNGSKSNKLE